MPRRGLYLVTPDWLDTDRLLAVARRALEGRPAMLQYRNKRAPWPLRVAQAAALRHFCSEMGVPLIVNDSLELALEVEADGLHAGREDGAPQDLRAALGAGCMLGVSCYDDFERARAAVSAGADYVAFGAMFPSRVKPDAVRASPQLVDRARRELGARVACIGGITLENAPPLVAGGADWLAVISDVFEADDPGRRCAEFAALDWNRGPD
jgi:thiamine-phosphate pyrophosphorylase